RNRGSPRTAGAPGGGRVCAALIDCTHSLKPAGCRLPSVLRCSAVLQGRVGWWAWSPEVKPVAKHGARALQARVEAALKGPPYSFEPARCRSLESAVSSRRYYRADPWPNQEWRSGGERHSD